MGRILTEPNDGHGLVSDWDREHMDDIIAGQGDWFTAKLLRLCAKADARNLERIRIGFPEVVDAYEEWNGIVD